MGSGLLPPNPSCFDSRCPSGSCDRGVCSKTQLPRLGRILSEDPSSPGAAPFLAMFCDERRIERELFWAGFGFQVWCQLLTHILRAETATVLVIDEPEIYLHPDLQHQLLSLLRDLGPDVLE